MITRRSFAGLSGSVIELSNYLEQRISQKSEEYAAVRKFKFYLNISFFYLYRIHSLLQPWTKLAKYSQSVTVLPVCTA